MQTERLIDFVHVGLHKTGSTWLQAVGFGQHPGICLLNAEDTELGAFFDRCFVYAGDFDFDAETFRERFAALVRNRTRHVTNPVLLGLSQENLSGHVYTGANARLLADRLRAVFGRPKIVIVLRNQPGMMGSLYANYVRNGGAKGPQGFLRDINIPAAFIGHKLQYDRLVAYYFGLFGKDRVKVLLHEDMVRDLRAFVSDLCGFLGVEAHYGPPAARVLNRGLSSIALRFTRLANGLMGRNLPLLNRVMVRLEARTPGRFRGRRDVKVPEDMAVPFKASNRRLEELLGVRLAEKGYPL